MHQSAHATDRDVESALRQSPLRYENFLALLSPNGGHYLEKMAQNARRISTARFGKIIQLYAPLYLSNECTNSCVYCGFNVRNPIVRRTLSVDEVEAEGSAVQSHGIRHILLVSGEAPKVVTLDYLEEVIRRLRPGFSSISLEIYPMDEDGYRRLVRAGADGMTLYQETYDRSIYGRYHPAGPKRSFERRLQAMDHAGRAGFRRLGIGALLGLNDWRYEMAAVALHAGYLMKRFWQCHITVSFPRLRKAYGGIEPPSLVSDRDLVQMICALRCYLPDAGLIVSTRESSALRDNLIPLGITQMSAGSRTEPGGYREPRSAEEQFSIEDKRSPERIAETIRRKGYAPVWKDWDPVLSG